MPQLFNGSQLQASSNETEADPWRSFVLMWWEEEQGGSGGEQLAAWLTALRSRPVSGRKKRELKEKAMEEKAKQEKAKEELKIEVREKKLLEMRKTTEVQKKIELKKKVHPI